MGEQIEASMTPYILEEREMRVTQMDIFSRLMRDRILWVAGVVNDQMSTVVQAQLMYLDSVEKRDITMHIDSPGGSSYLVDPVGYDPTLPPLKAECSKHFSPSSITN